MMTDMMKDVAGPGRGGRMSRQRKREAVLRLLRGEDLDTVSRSLGVTAATLSDWREAFLAAGEASLATRSAPVRRWRPSASRRGLARCCWNASCWRPRLPCWRAAAL